MFNIPTTRPGPTYFFTLRLADIASTRLLDRIEQLRAATKSAMRQHPFTITAIAVLPGTIHTIWQLPPQDRDHATRWAVLKTEFARLVALPSESPPHDSTVWHKPYHARVIGSAQELRAYQNLIYESPVQAGWCARPEDWLHCSLHRDRISAAQRMPAAIDHDTSFTPRKALIS